MRTSIQLGAALVVTVVSLIAVPAGAMSYQPIDDDALAARAEAIVVATVLSRASSPQSADLSHYGLQVERVLQGPLEVGPLDVTVVGSADREADGALVVPGAPRFADGERVLVFLERRGDGAWSVGQMVLGAFHLREALGGGTLALRDLDEARPLLAKSQAAPVEPNRDFERFQRWLQQRAQGGEPTPDYWSAAVPDPVAAPKFTTQGAPSRWMEFDEGRSVSLYASSASLIGVLGGGYAQVQQAIAAWNDDPGSRIRYAYAGTTAATGGLDRRDGINTVLFNDPLGEIAGIYDCTLGGVLAYAGYRSNGLRTVNGQSFRVIEEVDVVVQDGVGCTLSRRSNANAAELFTHELGHTLGLGHSCGDDGLPACSGALDDAVMRPTIHGDGRGARLGADDRAGAAYLYPASASSGGGTPSVPDNAGETTSGGSGGGGVTGPWLMALLGLGALLRRCRRR